MAGERLAPFGDRVTLVHSVYDEILDVLEDLGREHADAIFFDLGVSSMQLDVRERGFAYAQDAPLDMRMNDSVGITAADVLNTYPVEARSEEHTSELQSLMRISYAVFCLKKHKNKTTTTEFFKTSRRCE